MGILNLFSRKSPSGITRLPTGSFTVDGDGQLLVSTLPQSYPRESLREIGRQVIEAFRSARAARLSPTELVVSYAAFRLTARELRGGAIVFLSPRSLSSSPNVSRSV